MKTRVYVPVSLILFIVISYMGIAGTENVKMIIPLNEGVTIMNKELYSDFVQINGSSSIEINFVNIDKNISFIIFQVHSHINNITVYNNSYVDGWIVSGTNVGLYSSVTPKISSFFIKNPNSFDVIVFVTVHGYKHKDPIPGGCNMEFSVPISPYMRVIYQKDFIYVDAAPAKFYDDPDCMKIQNISIEFFMMYLPERNFDADTYFDGIRKMMTLENIKANGDRIPETAWSIRRMLSAYPGTGTIYVAVATNTDNHEYYSIYVPTHTYACSPDKEDCELIDDSLSKLICASLLFAGTFICFFGHKFFKTEMFVFGMLSGFVITYILLSLISHLDRPALVSASIISGACFGAMWLSFWWFYGIPVIAVMLPALNLGFFVAAIVYNKLPADLHDILQSENNFWIIFCLMMLLTALILSTVAVVSNILCCAVLGAYAAVYPIDFYIGSNLKYLIVNTVRRATVAKFGKAVLTLPMDWRDGFIIALWVIMAAAGFAFQHYQNRASAPFPPRPRSTRPAAPSEPARRYGAIPSIVPHSNRNIAPIVPTDPVIVTKKYGETSRLLA